jgi:hypothetical protein
VHFLMAHLINMHLWILTLVLHVIFTCFFLFCTWSDLPHFEFLTIYKVNGKVQNIANVVLDHFFIHLHRHQYLIICRYFIFIFIFSYQFINKTANLVLFSQVPLSFAIRVGSLKGTLRLHIKPPPSDQLWYGFTSMPDIDFNLESSVGDRKITSGYFSSLVVSRLKVW